MKVMSYDVMPHPEAKAMGVDFVDLDTLLKESDFITIHAALNEEKQRHDWCGAIKIHEVGRHPGKHSPRCTRQRRGTCPGIE